MRIITTALVLCLTLFATAQPDSLLAQKIDTLRKQEKYIQIIETLQTNLKTNNDLWTNYQLACYYSLTNDSSNAFYFLNKSIKKGADGKDILTDTDFENIHKCTNWSAVVDTLEKIHLTNNIGITHPELCVELWHIYIEDQRFRTLLKNYKKTFPKFRTPEYTEFSKQQRPLIKARKKRAKKIIKKYGWPTYTMVGKESADAVFLLFQHAEFKYLKKYLPLLKKAAFAGEASKKHYAMMYDRYLMYDGKKQCYGTQLTRSSSGINPDGSPKWGKLVFHPIENPETINQRRAEMGMTTIEKEAKKWKIEYNPNADVKLEKIH